MSEPNDPQAPLRDFRKNRDFSTGIDSDGCAFDIMEVKHRECFIPNIIRSFGLAAVSKYAREAAEFVNLFEEALPRSFAGTYAGDYMAEQVARPERLLPEKPPWKTV